MYMSGFIVDMLRAIIISHMLICWPNNSLYFQDVFFFVHVEIQLLSSCCIHLTQID